MRWLFAAVLLLACNNPFAPRNYEPAGMEEFQPPPGYAELWRQIDSCSGLPRPMTVRFFTAPDLGTNVAGRYELLRDRVYLLPWYATVAHFGAPAVIRHEMLHAHLHSVEHPAAYFGTGRCGALVSP